MHTDLHKYTQAQIIDSGYCDDGYAIFYDYLLALS